MHTNEEFIEELRRITNEKNGAIPQSEIRQYVDELVEKADQTLREMMLEEAQQGKGKLRLAPQFFANLVDRKYIDYCLDIECRVKEILMDRYVFLGFEVVKTYSGTVKEIVWDDFVTG